MASPRSNKDGKVTYIRLIIAGIILAISIWSLDIFVDVYYFHEGTYLSQSFEPGLFAFYMRILAVALILSFTLFALYNTRRLNISVRQLDAELVERQRIEAALRESETRFRLLVEQVPGAVYHWDLLEQGQCFYVSSEIEEMLGFSVQ